MIEIDKLFEIFGDNIPLEAMIVLQKNIPEESKVDELKKLARKDELLFRINDYMRSCPDNWTISGITVKKFLEEIYDYLKNNEKRMKEIEDAFTSGWKEAKEITLKFKSPTEEENLRIRLTKDYLNIKF